MDEDASKKHKTKVGGTFRSMRPMDDTEEILNATTHGVMKEDADFLETFNPKPHVRSKRTSEEV